MKKIFKKILQYYLKIIIKFVLFIHKPEIIAIAGSVNKTFSKESIAEIMRQKNISFRANQNSFNTEIGLPLAILSLPSGYNSYKNWLPVIYKSFFKIFEKKFPAYLILELGVAEKGDMKYLLSLVRPKIAVITDITKRYLESFKNLPGLLSEYSYLIENIPKNGLVIINNDNIIAKEILESAMSPIATFGIESESDWQAKNIYSTPAGQSVEICHAGECKKYQIIKFGRHHVYSLMIGLIIEKYLEKYEFKEEKNLQN